MPIDFRCSCGKKIRAKDERAGRFFTCPSCGAEGTVPGGNPFDPAPVLTPPPPPPASSSRTTFAPASPNLLACPDCGQQISVSAPSCPGCGRLNVVVRARGRTAKTLRQVGAVACLLAAPLLVVSPPLALLAMTPGLGLFVVGRIME